MPWQAGAVEIDGERLDAMVRNQPDAPPEVELDWRPGVDLGTPVTIAGKGYRVSALVNPGRRNERLRLDLEAEVAAAKPTKPNKGRRK